MNNVKCRHHYACPHKVVVKKMVEEVDEIGLPVQRYEDVNLLTSKQINTMPFDNYSLEAQLATNQPIKRVSTLTMDMQELSTNQLQQLENMAEDARQQQVQNTKTE